MADNHSKGEGGKTKVEAEAPAKVVESPPEEPSTENMTDKQLDSKPAVQISKANTAQQEAADQSRKRKRLVGLLVAVVLIIIIIVIVLAVVLTGDNDDDDPVDTPVERDYTTGTSLITYYAINATISSRLARTVLSIDVANGLDCAAIHSLTLQLPVAARVSSLKTWSKEDNCTTEGVVKPLEEAREEFLDQASSGLPAAYVEERDLFMHNLQISMSPYGTTSVEFVLEELLQLRQGKIEFQVPFVPNEEVDQIVFELTVLDFSESVNGTAFTLDLGSSFPDVEDSNTSDGKFHLDIPNAREYTLPHTLRGSFSPNEIPEDGYLYEDGTCFEHFFLPTISDLDPMPKNLLFLFDLGGHDNDKFLQAKIALKNLIDSLEPYDTLTIQTFNERGTEDKWGSTKATDEDKVRAKQYVDGLESQWGATNLHEAIIEGLLRANRDADDETGVVKILMLLSMNGASTGVTDRARIAKDVYGLNKKGKVKIFSMGFGNADHELLEAIAIMNYGKHTRIVEGPIDFATQMGMVFQSEFGTVLLSDVRVSFPSGIQVSRVTQQGFPVLAAGTEIVVRGLLTPSSSEEVFQVSTTGMGLDGEDTTWKATAVQDPFAPLEGIKNSRCYQTYAHARITHLLLLHKAAVLLGDEILEPIVEELECGKDESIADCIKEEALELALDAGVVARGLTGMVTVDNDQCQIIDEDAEICLDGTSRQDLLDDCADDGCETEGATGGDYAPDYGEGGYGYDDWNGGDYSSAGRSALSGFIGIGTAMLLFVWMAVKTTI